MNKMMKMGFLGITGMVFFSSCCLLLIGALAAGLAVLVTKYGPLSFFGDHWAMIAKTGIESRMGTLDTSTATDNGDGTYTGDVLFNATGDGSLASYAGTLTLTITAPASDPTAPTAVIVNGTVTISNVNEQLKTFANATTMRYDNVSLSPTDASAISGSIWIDDEQFDLAQFSEVMQKFEEQIAKQ